MKISVIIYSYNRKEFILEAIKSAYNQTLVRDLYEIIVVKSFSDPELDSEITKFTNTCITLNVKGHGKKIVSALDHASGDIICLLDDDDLFTKDKLQRIKDIFESQDDVIFIHNSIIRIDEKGDEIFSNRKTTHKKLELDTVSPDKKTLSQFMSQRVNWYGSCMSFRKDALIEVKEILGEIDQSIDPILFILTLRKSGKMIKIDDKLTKYRVHNSTTNYLLNFSDYVERRKEFYENTLTNYNRIIGITKGTMGELLLKVSITHLRLVISFLNRATKRILIKGSINLILSMEEVFIKYYFIWVFYSLIACVNNEAALKIFYLIQTSNRRSAIELRS